MKKLLCSVFLLLALICALVSCGHTHSWGEWITEKAATCTEDGTLKRYCNGCDEFETQTQSASHSYVNGVCTLCNEKEPSEGLYFTYSGTDDGYTVDHYNGSDTDVVIPAFYKGEPVTAIEYNAFYYDSITSITLPSSITYIGSGAFDGCHELKNVYIQDLESWYNIRFVDLDSNPLHYGADLYLNNVLVTEVAFAEGTTEINANAFAGCTSIESVTIPDGVTQIGNRAFDNCKNLKSVTIPNSVTKIDDDAFYGCPNIKEVHITSIEKWCKIKFGDSEYWEIIGGDLYLNGSLLTEVVIPDGITSIDRGPFCNRDSITSVVIPEGVTKINSEAFYGCDNLKSISLPQSLTYLSSTAFQYCKNLEGISIPGGVGTIYSEAFKGCENLKSVAIGDGITRIDRDAFRGLQQLEIVIMADSVKEIGTYAFYECVRLSTVYLGSGLEKINSGAFSSCKSLDIIYYNGSTSDWDLVINYGYNGTVWCNATQP